MISRSLCCLLSLLLAASSLAQEPSGLLERLKSPDPDVRRIAAEELGKQKATPTAVSALVNALKDKSTDVRIEAAFSLGSMGPAAKAALPALIEAGKDTSNLGGVLRPPPMPASVTEAAVAAALKVDPDCGERLAEAVLPSLIAGLKSKNGATIQACGFALAKLDSRAEPLVAALKEAWPQVGGFAAYAVNSALRASGVDPDPLYLEMLQDRKAPLIHRRQALLNLAEFGSNNDRVKAVVKATLVDPEVELRAEAVKRLRRFDLPDKSTVPILVSLLEDRALIQQFAADETWTEEPLLRTVSEVGADAVVNLTEMLANEKKSLLARGRAAQALFGMGRTAKSALPTLKLAAQEDNPFLALMAAGAYVRAGGPPNDVLPVLKLGLIHPAPGVLRFSVDVVASLGRDAAATVPLLIPLLKHEILEVRTGAVRALGQMGSAAKPAVPTMAVLLKSKSRSERIEAADALQNLGSTAAAALPSLIEVVKTSGEDCPFSVLRSIGNIGPEAKSAVPVLIDALSNTRHPVLMAAHLNALGRIGPEAKTALPVIRKLLDDEEDYVVRAAKSAIQSIEAEKPQP